MKKKLLCSFLLSLALSLLTSPVLSKEPDPEESMDGLELVTKKWRTRFYMDTSTDWSTFTKIQLEKATVEFRKHWVRDQKFRSNNRPTEKELNRIKTDLSELLDEVFKQELFASNTFVMSETGGENVMRITPRIVDLDIIAPDRMRDHIGYSITDSKGRMTLELDIHDSASGKLLARMIDTREDPQRDYWERTTSIDNKRAARFILIRWSSDLREWLVEARQTSPK
ncbi:MAG: DUF3313 domain-containing protein [Xanthomonadales bacterium]|nr:DUF3313 domain-containing protein [Xanthomonadales bacterium]MDH4018341.1 DUF3313 domain-containing protein [Xanthomonadales bacterium]